VNTAAALSGPGDSGQLPVVPSPQGGTELGTQVIIGAQNEWEATLPLTPAQDFLATPRQRSRIGRTALDQILAEDPMNRRLGFGGLRDEIVRRTGISDAAASLIVRTVEDRLEDLRSDYPD